MIRAALTKLAILVILVFIICLPEFFTLNKASVSLHCVWHQLCDNEEVGTEAKDVCGNQTCHEKEHCRAQTNLSDTTKAAIECFVCEADVNMSSSSSAAPNVYFQVWLSLHFTNTESVNFTVFGRYNHSSMQLQLFNEEEEEERKDDEGPNEVFLYCTALVDTEDRSRCLLWLSNQTFATARARLPWKRTTKDGWGLVLLVVWLSLLCVVLVLLVVTLLERIIKEKICCAEEARIQHFNTTKGQHKIRSINTERHCKVNPYKVLNRDTQIPRRWSVLSTIEEVRTPDGTNDMFFNENVDNGCNANLHQGGSSSSSIRVRATTEDGHLKTKITEK